MAGGLERTANVVSVGENGVPGAAFKGTPYIFAPGDRDHMSVLRAAFGNEQIVPAVFFVHMRAFGAASAGSVPDDLGVRQFFAGVQIDLKLADALGVTAFDPGAGVVDLAVVVPEQIGIDAVVVDPDGVGPGAADVFGPDKEIAAATDVGGDHVEAAVVITERGGVNAGGGPCVTQGQLAFPGQNVADLFPVDKILTVPQRHAGEKLKGTVDEVIVITNTADAGIRIETRDDRILVGRHGRSSLLLYKSILYRAAGNVNWQTRQNAPSSEGARERGSLFKEGDAVSAGAYMGADGAAQAMDGQIRGFGPEIRLVGDELTELIVV